MNLFPNFNTLHVHCGITLYFFLFGCNFYLFFPHSPPKILWLTIQRRATYLFSHCDAIGRYSNWLCLSMHLGTYQYKGVGAGMKCEYVSWCEYVSCLDIGQPFSKTNHPNELAYSMHQLLYTITQKYQLQTF